MGLRLLDDGCEGCVQLGHTELGLGGIPCLEGLLEGGAQERLPAVQISIQENRAEVASKSEADRLAEGQRLQTSIEKAMLLTIMTCSNLYKRDVETAILNSVCNDLFMKIGLPD